MPTVWPLSARQRAHARTIATVAVERFGGGAVGKLAAVYGVACSGAEASLTNWENDGRSQHVAKGGRISGRTLNATERDVCRRSRGLGDGIPPWGDNLDSVGLFAQRWLEGWGDVVELMKPRVAAGKFFAALNRVAGWPTLTADAVIRRVQGYHSDIYTDWLATAESAVAGFWASIPGTDPGAGKDWFEMASKDELKSIVADGFEAGVEAAGPKIAQDTWERPVVRFPEVDEYVDSSGNQGYGEGWNYGTLFMVNAKRTEDKLDKILKHLGLS